MCRGTRSDLVTAILCSLPGSVKLPVNSGPGMTGICNSVKRELWQQSILPLIIKFIYQQKKKDNVW